MSDSLYDHEKAMAFQTAVIQMAEVSGLNLLELFNALNPVVAVCKSAIATKLKDAAESDE